MSILKTVSRTLRLATPKYTIHTTRDNSIWTPNNIVKSTHEIEIPNRFLTEHIWENMNRWPDKTAVLCGITKRSLTYHQLYKRVRNFAAKLRTQFKICDGDVILIMMPNSPDSPLTMLGALEAGAVVTTVNPVYTVYEVQTQIVHSKPKLLIGIKETVPILKEAMNLAKLTLPIVSCKGYNDTKHSIKTIQLDELTSDDNVNHSILREVSIKSNHVALLPYSSGTTGLPKGVELTHRNIVANCVQQDVKGMMHYDETTNDHQDAMLVVLPLYHIYGMVLAMIHKLSVGVKLVTVPKFNPPTFLDALKEQKISLLNVAPPIVLYLGSHSDVRPEHLFHLKLMVCGAAPVPKIDIHRFLDRAKSKVEFIHAYGLTEASPLVTTMTRGSKNYTTVGIPVANTELKIVDSNLRTLSINEVGELLVRGPQTMKGYKDNPEATKTTITEDGWLRTGDLGSIDEDGAVTITDRLKELIKVKGYQVAPAELESLLREHPEVEDAAVVGVPDPRTGEAIKAFVVTKSDKFVEQNLINFVTDRVAEYKRIKEVVRVDNLPKNPTGKILRRVLKEKNC